MNQVTSAPSDFEAMWRDLSEVGRLSGGGYQRAPWTNAELELRDWFTRAATERGLLVEVDPFGNQVAWWGADLPGERVLVGSHLDSVPDGGAYDGPLGLVSAFAAIDLIRAQGPAPTRPVGVAAFVAEEGSRFPVACLGSRLAAGVLDWSTAAMLTDADGIGLGELIGGGTSTLLDGVGVYLELHIEQGRGLVDLDAPVGLASGIWPHGRWRYQITGRADHAGTTRIQDRADPMLTFAMTALAANKQARLSGQRATFGRVEVAPNSTNAVPSSVTAWLDARAETDADLDALVAQIQRQSAERAGRDGTALTVTAESASGAVRFDPGLRARLAGIPELATQAGHDAGILQGAGIASAMLFVRNPTGISHAPDEHATIPDCLAGVAALADAIVGLAQ